MLNRSALVSFVLLASAYGESGGDGTKPLPTARDAGDMPGPDARVDSATSEPSDAGQGALEGGPLTPPVRKSWVVAKLRIPESVAAAEQFAFDLNDDQRRENRLGQAYASLIGTGTGLDPQARADEAVDQGKVIVLIEALSPSFSEAASAMGRALEGGSPVPPACTSEADLACRKHLDGKGAFTAVTPATPYTSGAVHASAFAFGPGTTRIPVFLSHEPVWLRLERSWLVADVLEGGLHGRVGGAIPKEEIERALYPALHEELAAQVERDCPEGTCTEGSAGASVVALFDTDHDHQVSPGEVSGNAFVASLFSPDIDLDDDGRPDALSAGMGFEAVAGSFPEP